MFTIPLTRRHAIRFGVSVALFPTALVGASAASLPKRKNIDSLAPDELETYKHAIKILMQRSQTDPNVKEGYSWQARLHNDHEREEPDGLSRGCEHRSEIFFPWHRAHLAGFEFLLRATDPPRTSNLAIPYWDWTADPSGVRFPTAFEDANSPLFHSGRYHRAADVPNLPFLITVIKWDATAIRDMVRGADWGIFAGASDLGLGLGRVEQGPHNTIHPSIGPIMGNTATASLDPIYWSFHAYIDLVWARWQKLNVDGAHPQPCSLPSMKMWTEPFVPAAADMAQTEGMPTGYSYGYDYDFSKDDRPVVTASGPVNRRSLAVAQKTNQFSRSEAVRLPTANRSLLRVADVAIFRDLTYAIDAYAHPLSVDIVALGEEERKRYLADSATVWMSGGHSHKPTTIYFDMTKAAAQYGQGEVAITVLSHSAPLASSGRAGAQASISGKPLWGELSLEDR